MSEWLEGTIARLRELWAEGVSTAEIGRRLGVSKNAVVGKAHRLDLPSRPTPIRRDGEKKPRIDPVERKTVTLPPLPSVQAPAPMSPTAFKAASVALQTSRPATKGGLALVQPQVPPITKAPASPPRPVLGKHLCSWPIGELGTRGFRYCDEPGQFGKPYCPDHCKIAYIRVRDRKEAA